MPYVNLFEPPVSDIHVATGCNAGNICVPLKLLAVTIIEHVVHDWVVGATDRRPIAGVKRAAINTVLQIGALITLH